MSYEKTGKWFKGIDVLLIALALFIGVTIGSSIINSPKCQYEDEVMLSGGVCVAIDDLNVSK